MENFLKLLENDKSLIEKKLFSIYDENNFFENMCKYSFSMGGKRIRAILFLESFKSFKTFSDTAVDFAVALELIHNYSLVHDDLPEMDDDKYRRGNLSVYGKFGQSNAVLVGDELLNDSAKLIFNSISKIDDLSFLKNAIKTAEYIYNLSGINGMVLGQFFDLKNDIEKLEDIEKIDSLKTSALFRAAIVGGAMLSGACDEDLSFLENYALSLGMSFQLQDDLFDFDEDLKIKKKTYATFLSKEKLNLKIKQLNDFAFSQINKISGKKDFFVKFIDFMAKRTF